MWKEYFTKTKIRVGMSLTIRRDLSTNMDIKFGVVPDMVAEAGARVVIRSYDDTTMKISLENVPYDWHPLMFEEFKTHPEFQS